MCVVKSLFKKSSKLFSQEHTSILSAAVVIGFAYLASAGLGLIRNRLLAARFFGGLESHLDAYFAAFVLPDTIFQLIIVGALSVAFIPVYTQYLKKGADQANRLVNATLNSIFLILFAVTLVIFIFALPIAHLMSNFPEGQTVLMAHLMRIMLMSQLFFAVSSFMTAITQAHRRFLIPAIAPLFYNFGTILGIVFLTPIFGIYGAAYGVVFGAFLHLLIQIPLTLRLGFRYQFILDGAHEGVRTIKRLMVPRTLALAILQIERWVAVFFGSLFLPGSISMLNFSRQLYSLPISLFGVSLGQASFPTLSMEASDDKMSSFKNTLTETLLQIFFFSFPASILLLILRIPIVRISFGARSFPWEATLQTAKMVAILSLSIAPQAASHVLIRAFHALHDSKTPLFISVFTVILNLVLSFVLTIVYDFDVLGLSYAITTANFMGGLLLIIYIQRKIGQLNVWSSGLKMIVATLATGICLWVPMRLLDQFVFDTTRTFPLIALSVITSFVGLLVYFIFSQLFQIPQLESVKNTIRKVGNWQKVLSDSEEIIDPTDSHTSS